jgi:hypothetical protein
LDPLYLLYALSHHLYLHPHMHEPIPQALLDHLYALMTLSSSYLPRTQYLSALLAPELSIRAVLLQMRKKVLPGDRARGPAGEDARDRVKGAVDAIVQIQVRAGDTREAVLAGELQESARVVKVLLQVPLVLRPEVAPTTILLMIRAIQSLFVIATGLHMFLVSC